MTNYRVRASTNGSVEVARSGDSIYVEVDNGLVGGEGAAVMVWLGLAEARALVGFLSELLESA